jgi:TPR repeat protein
MHPIVQRLLAMARHVHVDHLPAATLFEAYVDVRQLRGDEVLDVAWRNIEESGAAADGYEVLDAMCVWLLEQPDPQLVLAARCLLALLAETGFPRSQYNYGIALRNDGMHRAARSQFLRALQDEDLDANLRAHALFALGEQLADGVGCRRNLRRAFSCFWEAAQLMHPEANFAAATFLHGKERGWHGPRNPNLAATYYARAMALGVDEARTNLGCLHALGEFDGADQEHGLTLLRESAAEGDDAAHYALALIGGLLSGASADISRGPDA